MKYSVIIGLYNHLKNLPELVDALEGQTYHDFEVIFCDDGSTDGTKEHFEKKPLYKFPYKYIWQKNKGMRLAKSLNNGIKAATGKYCTFIMGDSFPELNYMEVLDQFSRPDCLLCGIRIQISGEIAVDLDWRLKKGRIPNDDAIVINNPYRVFTGNGLTIPTWALQEYGGWPEWVKGYGGDDNELIARMYYKGIVCWSLGSAKLYHRWHKAQIDGGNSKKVEIKIREYAGKILS